MRFRVAFSGRGWFPGTPPPPPKGRKRTKHLCGLGRFFRLPLVLHEVVLFWDSEYRKKEHVCRSRTWSEIVLSESIVDFGEVPTRAHSTTDYREFHLSLIIISRASLYLVLYQMRTLVFVIFVLTLGHWVDDALSGTSGKRPGIYRTVLLV